MPTPESTLVRRGYWIDEWDPGNEAFWEAEGKTIARKNLILSIFAEHIGFQIWVFPEFLAGHPFIATYLAGLGFVGELIGSMSRPFGGWLSDRPGGARVTLACFLGMTVFTGTAIIGVNTHDFTLFFASFMVIFFLAGAGNGSNYRMIPSIFTALGRKEAAEQGLDPVATKLDFKRRAAAVIGIAGAIGAFGGFLIQVALREASLGVSAAVKAAETPALKAQIAIDQSDWSVSALWVFFGAYFLFAAMTYFFYLRRSFATDRIPSLASASV